MTKLTFDDKENIYKEKQEGLSYRCLATKYKIRDSKVKYLIRLIDIHGLQILRTTKNKYHPILEKQEAINRVLINGESIWSVSLDIGLLSDGMLFNWVSKYKENGYNIVERKRGRSPTIMKKPAAASKEETEKEKIRRLEEENLYLKAELEYSKKLRAVVQARKNQRQKKK